MTAGRTPTPGLRGEAQPGVGDQRFDAALPDALALVGAVHDRIPDDVTQILGRCTDAAALCVVLAALVPDDCAVSVLLAWADRANVTRIEPRRTAAIRGRTDWPKLRENTA
jgi:hypothetical protein